MKSQLSCELPVVIEPLDARLLFAAGDLDLSFGRGGQTRIPTIDSELLGLKVVNGKGYAATLSPVRSESGDYVESFQVARVGPSGAVERIVNDRNSGIGTTFDSITGFAIQPDGKILVGGRSFIYGWHLKRYLADGSVDPSWTTTKIALNGLAEPVVMPDGKIVVGGYFDVGGGIDSVRMGLARLNKDGRYDRTFGTSGVAILPDLPGRVTHVAAQPDGKLIVGGQYDDGDTDDGAIIARTSAKGVLDESWPVFDSQAMGDSDRLAGLKIGPNGDVYYALGLETSGQSQVEPYRISADGTARTAYERYVFQRSGGYSDAQVHLGTDGRMVITGATSYVYRDGLDVDETGAITGRIARWESDGSFDLSMGGDGIRSVRSFELAQLEAGKNRIWTLGRDATGTLYIGRRTYADAPAADGITLINGRLGITGTAGSDTIRVSTRGTQIDVLSRGVTRTFSLSSVKMVLVNGLSGNDQITIRTTGSLHVRVNGGAGDDVIDGGTWVDGFDGNDRLTLRGSGYARGGLGSDWIDASYSSLSYVNALAGRPEFNAGYSDTGINTVTFENSNRAVSVELPPESQLLGGFNRVRLSRFNDVYSQEGAFAFSGENVQIFGLAGDDTIRGTSYADIIDGGPGRDKLYGLDGNDTFYALDGIADLIDGGSATDETDTAYADNVDTLRGIEIVRRTQR